VLVRDGWIILRSEESCKCPVRGECNLWLIQFRTVKIRSFCNVKWLWLVILMNDLSCHKEKKWLMCAQPLNIVSTIPYSVAIERLQRNRTRSASTLLKSNSSIPWLVHLKLSIKFINHLTMFFYNKSANNIFSHDFSYQRIEQQTHSSNQLRWVNARSGSVST
jgi:hypothetical protein